MAQTNQSDPPRRRRTGAYATGEETARRRAGWLIPLLVLLGLLLIGFLLWLVLHDRGSDSPTTAAATPTSSVGPTATSSADPASASASASVSASASAGSADGGTAADGQLLAGGQSMLPLASGTTDLSRYTGQAATARKVNVQSVPADEGFWVGTSTTDRVWVHLTGGTGESPVTVKTGDTISFSTGKVAGTPAGFAEKVGVATTEGAAQLTAQKAHIEIAKSAITVNP